jgi:phage gpG-like protein
VEGVSIRIDIDVTPTRTGLRALQAAGGDMRDTYDVLGRRWVDLTKERFAQGNAPDGTPWKPSQRAEKEGGQTLVLTRRLENSLTHEADDTGVTVGTNVIYARPQQLGATILHHAVAYDPESPIGMHLSEVRVTLPPRPFLGVNQDYLDEFGGIITKRLRRIVSMNGGDAGGAE